MTRLTTVVLALFASAANGQFLRASFSSISESRGERGQMHQQVHSVQQAVDQQGDMMMRTQTETVCADGRCHERQSISMRPRDPELLMDYDYDYYEPCSHSTVEEKPPYSELALASVVPRPGPRQVEINAPALLMCISLAALALGLGAMTVVHVMMSGSAPVVEDRPVVDMAVPLAGSSVEVAAALPAARKSTKKVQQKEKTPAAVAEPAVVRAPFHFKPSVGTWLLAR